MTIRAALVILFIGLIGFWQAVCPQPADAHPDKLDVMRGITNEADNNWHVSVGGATGMTVGGESYSIMDAIVETPEDAPNWFKLLPTKSWHRYVVTPAGNEKNITRFEYELGDSNNFWGAALRDQDNLAAGVLYNPEHWGVDWLSDFTFSGFVEEGKGYIAGIDGDTELFGADGYGIETHWLFYFDDSFGYYEANGNIEAYHNLNPTGDLKLSLGYAAWTTDGFEEDFMYLILKGTL